MLQWRLFLHNPRLPNLGIILEAVQMDTCIGLQRLLFVPYHYP